jgi:hypothetical protein
LRVALVPYALFVAVQPGCGTAHPPRGQAPTDGAKADGAGSAGSAGSYLRNERFDALPTGAPPPTPWTTEATEGASVLVQEIPFAGDKSVELR